MLWVSLFGAIANIASTAFSAGNQVANTAVQTEIAKMQLDADTETNKQMYLAAVHEQNVQREAAADISGTMKDTADVELKLAEAESKEQIASKRIEEHEKLETASKLDLNGLRDKLHNRAPANYGKPVIT